MWSSIENFNVLPTTSASQQSMSVFCDRIHFFGNYFQWEWFSFSKLIFTEILNLYISKVEIMFGAIYTCCRCFVRLIVQFLGRPGQKQCRTRISIRWNTTRKQSVPELRKNDIISLIKFASTSQVVRVHRIPFYDGREREEQTSTSQYSLDRKKHKCFEFGEPERKHHIQYDWTVEQQTEDMLKGSSCNPSKQLKLYFHLDIIQDTV